MNASVKRLAPVALFILAVVLVIICILVLGLPLLAAVAVLSGAAVVILYVAFVNRLIHSRHHK